MLSYYSKHSLNFKNIIENNKTTERALALEHLLVGASRLPTLNSSIKSSPTEHFSLMWRYGPYFAKEKNLHFWSGQ